MPEGDALHRIAERLQVLAGERVEASSPHPRGLATNVARVIDGRVLESVEAVGKHLLLRFEGNVTLRSHLRMNGRWRVEPRRERPRAGLPWLSLRTEHWEATQGGCGRTWDRTCSPTKRRSTSSQCGSAQPTRPGSSVRCCSISGSSPGSGTCGSPSSSGTRRSRPGFRWDS
jgi:hypothetical protein